MKFTSLFSVLFAAAASLALHAQTTTTVTTAINVPDGSFESSYGSTNSNPNIASGWVFNVNGGSWFGVGSISSAYSSEGAASGSNYAYINNDDPGVTNTITSVASLASITADTTYTLSLAVGNPSAQDTGLYGQPGPVSFSLLANGQVFATETVPNGSVSNGTFDDFSLTYTTPDSGSIIGENLTIQLASLPEHGTAYVPGLDNVQLEETTIEAAPEPAVWTLLVTAGLAFLPFTNSRRRTKLSETPTTAAAVACAVLVIFTSSLQSTFADSISVPNSSFETSTSGGGWTYGNPDILDDWTFNAPAGTAYGQLWLVFFNSPGTSQGNQSAFIENETPGVEASLTSAYPLGSILADTTYTLTVAVGNADLNNPALETGPLVFDPIGDIPPAPVTLTLLAGGQPFAIEAIPAGMEPGGAWQDFSLSYTTGDTDPVIGQQLTIQLGTYSDSGQPEAAVFDNVRLDATANETMTDGGSSGIGDPGTAPEPPGYGLLGIGLASLGWLARWQRFKRDCLC